jgi:cytochrome b561
MNSSRNPAAIAPRGYGSVAVAFHWLTAVLVLAAFVMSPGGSEQRVYSAANDFDRQIHEVLGLTVFSLTLLRLVSRAFAPAPQLPSAPRWMNRISKVVQGLLYTYAVVWLAGFHAAAALFHHFVLRDEVLLSMLPARWRRRRLS